VAALTVSALSAEIGSAWSTLTEGYVSRANASALAMGVGIGELALSALARIAAGGS
jgi:hypothetical protein